ncbi:hypothetical protein ACOSQ2_002303 [Xanthoceras sorbifolium]
MRCTLAIIFVENFSEIDRDGGDCGGGEDGDWGEIEENVREERPPWWFCCLVGTCSGYKEDFTWNKLRGVDSVATGRSSVFHFSSSSSRGKATHF